MQHTHTHKDVCTDKHSARPLLSRSTVPFSACSRGSSTKRAPHLGSSSGFRQFTFLRLHGEPVGSAFVRRSSVVRWLATFAIIVSVMPSLSTPRTSAFCQSLGASVNCFLIVLFFIALPLPIASHRGGAFSRKASSLFLYAVFLKFA